MTDRQIKNRIQRLQELEQQIKELEMAADDLRTEIKVTMEDRQTRSGPVASLFGGRRSSAEGLTEQP